MPCTYLLFTFQNSKIKQKKEYNRCATLSLFTISVSIETRKRYTIYIFYSDIEIFFSKISDSQQPFVQCSWHFRGVLRTQNSFSLVAYSGK